MLFMQKPKVAEKHPFNIEIHGSPVEPQLVLSGKLTVDVPADAWRAGLAAYDSSAKPEKVVFDLSNLTALDLNGAAQLLNAIKRLKQQGPEVETSGLPEHLTPIFELADKALKEIETPEKQRQPNFIERWGSVALALKSDGVELLSFLGNLLCELLYLILHPRRIPWRNVFNVFEVAGVNALPISCLVLFLVGLILAFQAAMLMKMFGAEIYVADLIGIAMVRELGALVTAIILAGRSGSAFSAELGSMKINQEIDALLTMGLSPVRELVAPRVLAAIFYTPMVTIIACFASLIGGNVVLLAMGYPISAYWVEVVYMVSMNSYLIGLFKSIVFGFVIAAVGCQRGLAAGDGPGAVGVSTTSGVVTNIVLIAVLDSIFAVVFYVLDI